jgi:hypothetical protein
VLPAVLHASADDSVAAHLFDGTSKRFDAVYSALGRLSGGRIREAEIIEQMPLELLEMRHQVLPN